MISAHVAAAVIQRAADCSATRRPLYLTIKGTVDEGGVTGTFVTIIDLRNGFRRADRTSGVEQTIEGYNGYGHGIANAIDVPPLIADGEARAFVARLGWADPSVTPARVLRESYDLKRIYTVGNMSAVTVVWKNGASHPSQAILDGDKGLETNDLADWRCVAGISYPFKQTRVDPDGESQSFAATAVVSGRTTRASFVAPAPQAEGHITGTQPAPFHFSGKNDFHINVDAVIDGTPELLNFDTGGAHYIGTTAAKQLGLAVNGGVSIGGVGSSSINVGFAPISSITVANGTLSDQVTVVAPLPWPETATSPVGVTSFQFLAEFRTTIDYPNQTIVFASPTDPPPIGAIRLPLTMEGHFPLIQAEVNGVAGWFGVDTGDAGAVTLFKTFTDRSGVGPDPTLEGSTAGGVGGNQHLSQARTRSFSLGGINLTNARMRLANMNAGAFSSRRLAGNLGAGFLRCFKVTFDYSGRAMYLSRSDSTDSCLQGLTG